MWVANFTPRQIYPLQRKPAPIEKVIGWPRSLFGRLGEEKNLFCIRESWLSSCNAVSGHLR
jgi:hypothetical protein